MVPRERNDFHVTAPASGKDIIAYVQKKYGVRVFSSNIAHVKRQYTLLARCGLEPGQIFDESDFVHVYECDTPDSVMALGDAVSQCSEMVLRTIEHEIKRYLRDKQAGQGTRPASPSPEPGTPAAA